MTRNDPEWAAAMASLTVSDRVRIKLILACFFKVLPAAQKFWQKQGLCISLRELRKSIWST